MKSNPVNARKRGAFDRPCGVTRILIALSGWVGLLGATAAHALPFTTVLAYDENFVGETIYPTTPEIDLFAAGGLAPDPSAGSPAALVGSSVQFQVSQSDFRDGVELILDPDTISTVESDVGMRGEYSGVDFSGSGEGRIIQLLRFTLDDDLVLGGSFVGSALQIMEFQSNQIAMLWVREERDRIEPPAISYSDSRITNLSLVDANRILAGEEFTLDVAIDRTQGTAQASIQIGGDPEITTDALPLLYAQDYSVSSARQYLDLAGIEPITVEARLEQFQIYAEPHEYVPLFNIDVGSFWGTPTPGYAAAGGPGFWNELGFAVIELADLSGETTDTTAQLSAQSLGLIEANGGETRDLLADWAADPLGWTLTIDDLPSDGAYRATFYTLGSGFAESGTLFANGESHPSLPGVGVPSLVEGQSFARIDTLVTGGLLDLSAVTTGAAAPIPTHLSGVQIERTVPLPEPGFGLGLSLSLSFSMAFGVLCNTRMRGRGRPGQSTRH